MPAQLYIVELDDRRDERLAGHTGCTYSSPPQAEAQALALVRALLGCPPDTVALDDAPWHVPVAGGRRAIRLYPVNPDGQLPFDATLTA